MGNDQGKNQLTIGFLLCLGGQVIPYIVEFDIGLTQ